MHKKNVNEEILSMFKIKMKKMFAAFFAGESIAREYTIMPKY